MLDGDNAYGPDRGQGTTYPRRPDNPLLDARNGSWSVIQKNTVFIYSQEVPFFAWAACAQPQQEDKASRYANSIQIKTPFLNSQVLKLTMKKFGFVLIVLLAMLAAAGAAMKHKEWTDAELQALETSWEANDSEEELDSFERRHRLISEMHKNKKDTDE